LGVDANAYSALLRAPIERRAGRFISRLLATQTNELAKRRHSLSLISLSQTPSDSRSRLGSTEGDLQFAETFQI
jgi:hypothetical protein